MFRSVTLWDMKTYPIGLCQKIVAAVDQRLGAYEEIAEMFGVAEKYIYKPLKQRRETGSLASLPRGGEATTGLNEVSAPTGSVCPSGITSISITRSSPAPRRSGSFRQARAGKKARRIFSCSGQTGRADGKASHPFSMRSRAFRRFPNTVRWLSLGRLNRSLKVSCVTLPERSI
jgi:hypothetical protein